LVAEMPDDAKLVEELSMRILNRPAPMEEVTAAASAMQALDQDLKDLQTNLAKYEQELAPVLVEREAKRQSQITAAQQAHDGYAAEIKPREEAAEAERQTKIAAAQTDLTT